MLSSVHVASLLVCGSMGISVGSERIRHTIRGCACMCSPGVGMFAWDDVQRCNSHTEGL